MILRRGPLTAEIALMSVVLSWIVGIPVAIVSALRPNSLGDNISRFLSILFLAVPGFWVGMLIVLGLLFWFGYRAPLADASLFWTDPWANLQIVIGPAIVLGLGQAAYIARMARSSLLEVIREDYVRTARAKGLSGRLVIACTRCPMRCCRSLRCRAFCSASCWPARSRSNARSARPGSATRCTPRSASATSSSCRTWCFFTPSCSCC